MSNITTTGNGHFNRSLTMTSLEIAELTEKEHKHVCRDIRSMLDKLAAEKLAVKEEKYKEMDKGSPEYDRGSRKQYKYVKPSSMEKTIDFFLPDGPDMDHHISMKYDERGYVAHYILDLFATMTLITGYDIKRRSLVIDRWMKLESGEAVPLVGGISPAALEELVRRVVSMARPMLQEPGRFIETSSVNDYLAWLPHELKKDRFSTKFDLYDTYALYCSEAGRVPDPASLFFIKLYRCRPTLKSARILVDGKRPPVVLGISIMIGLEDAA